MTVNPFEQPDYLFRCLTCGKWSHAKDKPRSHQRWVRPGEAGYDQAESDKNADVGVPDGHFVKCGPFRTFHALPSMRSQ